MAIGKSSDMVIYQAEFQSGLVERVTQFLSVFNEASRGAIRLIPNALKGHYSKEAFFADVAGLVSRRNTASVSAPGDLALTQGEVIGVKLNRKVGPVAQTIDAMRKAGLTVADASRVFGQLAAQHKMKEMVNSALLATEAAIRAVTSANNDITGASTKTANALALNATLGKFGDASGDIVCWVMHSKPHFDLTGGLLSGTVSGLADVMTIQGAIPALLGRPALVTDSPALTDANGSDTDTYNTLGLVRDAVVVEESEPEVFATDLVTGLENLVQRFQAEYAYNVKVKGHKWNTGVGGGENPDDTAVGTHTNWVQVATDDKNTAGVRLLSQ